MEHLLEDRERHFGDVRHDLVEASAHVFVRPESVHVGKRGVDPHVAEVVVKQRRADGRAREQILQQGDPGKEGVRAIDRFGVRAAHRIADCGRLRCARLRVLGGGFPSSWGSVWGGCSRKGDMNHLVAGRPVAYLPVLYELVELGESGAEDPRDLHLETPILLAIWLCVRS